MGGATVGATTAWAPAVGGRLWRVPRGLTRSRHGDRPAAISGRRERAVACFHRCVRLGFLIPQFFFFSFRFWNLKNCWSIAGSRESPGMICTPVGFYTCATLFYYHFQKTS